MSGTWYARGHVWKSGDTWHYEVVSNGRVVMTDNTNDWWSILRDCNLATAAAHIVSRHGHRLRRWNALVDEANPDD